MVGQRGREDVPVEEVLGAEERIDGALDLVDARIRRPRQQRDQICEVVSQLAFALLVADGQVALRGPVVGLRPGDAADASNDAPSGSGAGTASAPAHWMLQ